MYRRHETGRVGEEVACDYVKKLGYEIIEKNYRNKMGEIDIIAKDKNEIIFIEVKTRCQKKYGSPSEAVDRRKKRHIYHVAEFYLIINKLENAFCRIDVIEVYFKDEKILVNHIKNSVQDRTFKDKFQIFEEDYDFEIE